MKNECTKARVLIFTADGPNPDGPPFVAEEDAVEMSRVPTIGEIVCVGNDEHGVSADYRVVLVRHDDDDEGAEIYCVRVNIADEILSVAPKTPWRKPGT